MAKKRSKKKKNMRAGADGYSTAKKPGMLIYVPAFCTLIGTLMLLVVIAAAIPLSVPEFMGYEIYNVVSGSMEPTIPIGSIIYVKPSDPVDIEKGDIIAFESGDSIVMHRVIQNDVINGEFTTKGDANAAEDINEVRYKNLVGVVAYHIPVLGQLLILYASSLGKICMISFAACGALLNILASRFSDYLKYEREEERLKEEYLAAARKADQEAKAVAAKAGQDAETAAEKAPEADPAAVKEASEANPAAKKEAPEADGAAIEKAPDAGPEAERETTE